MRPTNSNASLTPFVRTSRTPTLGAGGGADAVDGADLTRSGMTNQASPARQTSTTSPPARTHRDFQSAWWLPFDMTSLVIPAVRLAARRPVHSRQSPIQHPPSQ